MPFRRPPSNRGRAALLFFGVVSSCFAFTVLYQRSSVPHQPAAWTKQPQETLLSTHLEQRHDDIAIGASTLQGWRPYQEDRYDIKTGVKLGEDTWHYLAVFDGHGGDKASEYLKTHLREELFQFPHLLARDPQSVMKRSFQRIDHDFLNLARRNAWPDGSTACVAMLRVSPAGIPKVIVGNIGDSRAVLGRGGIRGTVIALSSDHKPNREDEKRRVESAGGIVATGTYFPDAPYRVFYPITSTMQFGDQLGGGLAMSRAIGDLELKDISQTGTKEALVINEPEFVEEALEWRKGEVVVVASDGIWDVLSNEEAVKIALSTYQEKVGTVASFTAANMAAEAIVTEALKRQSADNLTALVLLTNAHNSSDKQG